MYNKIRLVSNSVIYSDREWKNFEKGSAICGEYDVHILKEWNVDEIEEAKKELENYSCYYGKTGQLWTAEEYALEYYAVDENGDFDFGSDYDFAKEMTI